MEKTAMEILCNEVKENSRLGNILQYFKNWCTFVCNNSIFLTELYGIKKL